MRFNEKELATLASQHTCEKEGLLYFRERQEGFFRKNEGEQKYELKKCFDGEKYQNFSYMFFIFIIINFSLIKQHQTRRTETSKNFLNDFF